MPLTQAQKAIISKARALGGGRQGVALDDAACIYLVGLIVQDLNLRTSFPELPADLPSFFGSQALETLKIDAATFMPLFERLLAHVPDADTYFLCLATLHKSRLKYERILQTQPLATIDQVGPRGLLQYGMLSNRALAGLLLWRKWMFDIDNRAGQETGYLFEPIIAHSIGGTPASARKSPIHREGDPRKGGRQVDCIIENGEKRAYEIKIRVTIAASGQGRWREELAFPEDCRGSGYTPVLVVLDPTRNDRLDELQAAFIASGGEVYTGPAAWDHLDSLAGPTMARLLERYVHEPIAALLQAMPDDQELPPITLRMNTDELAIAVGQDLFVLPRNADPAGTNAEESLPDDVDAAIPGA